MNEEDDVPHYNVTMVITLPANDDDDYEEKVKGRLNFPADTYREAKVIANNIADNLQEQINLPVERTFSRGYKDEIFDYLKLMD